MTRRVLLVGSLPFDDEASAMARAIELVGDRLISLPDGEIGERSDQYPSGDRSQWVAGLAGRLAAEPSLFDVVDPGTMNEQGFPVDFDSTARLRSQLALESLTDVLLTIERARGSRVDVACACGLGRRSTETAEELLLRCRQLADQTPEQW